MNRTLFLVACFIAATSSGAEPPPDVVPHIPSDSFACIRLHIGKIRLLRDFFGGRPNSTSLNAPVYDTIMAFGPKGQNDAVVIIRFAERVDAEAFQDSMNEHHLTEKALPDGRKYFTRGNDHTMLVGPKVVLHVESGQRFARVLDGEDKCPDTFVSMFADESDSTFLEGRVAGVDTQTAEEFLKWRGRVDKPAGEVIHSWLTLLRDARLRVIAGPHARLELRAVAVSPQSAEELRSRLTTLLEQTRQWLAPAGEAPLPWLSVFKHECLQESLATARIAVDNVAVTLEITAKGDWESAEQVWRAKLGAKRE